MRFLLAAAILFFQSSGVTHQVRPADFLNGEGSVGFSTARLKGRCLEIYSVGSSVPYSRVRAEVNKALGLISQERAFADKIVYGESLKATLAAQDSGLVLEWSDVEVVLDLARVKNTFRYEMRDGSSITRAFIRKEDGDFTYSQDVMQADIYDQKTSQLIWERGDFFSVPVWVDRGDLKNAKSMGASGDLPVAEWSAGSYRFVIDSAESFLTEVRQGLSDDQIHLESVRRFCVADGEMPSVVWAAACKKGGADAETVISRGHLFLFSSLELNVPLLDSEFDLDVPAHTVIVDRRRGEKGRPGQPPFKVSDAVKDAVGVADQRMLDRERAVRPLGAPAGGFGGFFLLNVFFVLLCIIVWSVKSFLGETKK